MPVFAAGLVLRAKGEGCLDSNAPHEDEPLGKRGGSRLAVTGVCFGKATTTGFD
jgi:hypothetical protein